MIIEGAISVKSAVLNHRRRINKVYIDTDKTSKDFKFIINKLKDYGIKYTFVKRSVIDEIATGKTHGGIIADVDARLYQNINSVKEDNIFVIDGIEDPFNVGYILRTLRAFGYKQVIFPRRDFSTMEATILKSSAGAFDQMDVILSDNLYEDLSELKKTHRILALSRSDEAKDVFDYQYNGKNVIMLGGEKRGIQKELMKLVDQEIFIDYPSDFRNALNAASALSVMVTVLEMRKRDKHD